MRPNSLEKCIHINIENIVVVYIIMIIVVISEKQSLMMMRYICMKALLENKLNLGDLTEACRDVNCRATCLEKQRCHMAPVFWPGCQVSGYSDQRRCVGISELGIGIAVTFSIDLTSKFSVKAPLGFLRILRVVINLLQKRFEMITTMQMEEAFPQQIPNSFHLHRLYVISPAVETQQVKSITLMCPLDLPGLSGTQNRSPLPRPAQEIVSDGIWTSANGVSQLTPR
jgi:hypothetical protein